MQTERLVSKKRVVRREGFGVAGEPSEFEAIGAHHHGRGVEESKNHPLGEAIGPPVLKHGF